jgi:hypothetical protein
MTHAPSPPISIEILQNTHHSGARCPPAEAPTPSLNITPRAHHELAFADTEPDGTRAIARCYELGHTAHHAPATDPLDRPAR